MINPNTFYKCPYCGKEYADPVDMANCIKRCDKLAKDEKLKKEKAARDQDLQEAADRLTALINRYKHDYGQCEYLPPMKRYNLTRFGF